MMTHSRATSLLRRAALAACAMLAAALLMAAGAGVRRTPSPLGPPSPDCALAGLDRSAVPFVLETSEGAVHCSLDAARAPHAVAMVVGLATGRAPFRERGGGIVRRPYYDDLPFFRAVADGLVQTGCPLGDGTGHPGYRIGLEEDASDAARLARPGVLLLARYTPPPNRTDPAPPPPGLVIGSQLVVAVMNMSHLAGKVTVIGACDDLDVVRRISRGVAGKTGAVVLRRTEVPGARDGGSCLASEGR